MTPQRARRIRAVLDRRQPDLRVLTDSVHKGHNLSAIVRSADAFGVLDMDVVVGDGDYRAYRSTAMGSQRWVCLHRHSSVEAALASQKAAGYQVVVAHLDPTAVDFRTVDYTRPTVLLMGAEKQGPGAAALAAADHYVTIPMVGMVESFNVSVAAALLLAEAYRQREAAGLFAQPRLDPTRYERLFFEWGEPKLAAFCQRRGLPYPALNPEDGSLLDPGWFARVQAAEAEDAAMMDDPT
ncbi:MAG: tRNA (guanosine(18)-2'-O)-methyltransferase TrmH [Proteobacteria bacterium]|nr:tRNA (guanosine(18)-2'-O)-methyltransferase TrmH [Pseudomonadota bacterium]